MANHYENVAQLWDYGESSGTGPWIKLSIPPSELLIWRGNKGSTYEITACQCDEVEGEFKLNKDVLWRNEGQQLGFGETDTRGGWVKFRVEPEDIAFFRGNKDETYYWKFILMEKVEETKRAEKKVKTEKGKYSHEVRDLHQHGFFRAPALWKILGTDKSYQEFTRNRRCIVTGGYDWDGEKGVERTEFAHVRRAGDSGTAYKPEYSGVPLVHEIHRLQHNGGEEAVYRKYLVRRGKPTDGVTYLTAKAWFEKKAMENVEKWAHTAMLEKYNHDCGENFDSLTKIDPVDFRAWAVVKNVSQYLPRCYKEAQ